MRLRQFLYNTANRLTVWAIRVGIPRPPYTRANALIVETVDRCSDNPLLSIIADDQARTALHRIARDYQRQLLADRGFEAEAQIRPRS